MSSSEKMASIKSNMGFSPEVFTVTTSSSTAHAATSLRSTIEALSAADTIPDPAAARAAFLDFRSRLTRGEVRAAEKVGAAWTVNAWVKQGILLGFRLGELK